MPVGQAVTATSERPLVGAVAAGAVAGGAVAGGAVTEGAGASPMAACTSETTSSGVAAARRLSVKSFLTRARASLVSSCRWVTSPPAGAAIRNARSAGPSLAPKSTFGESRANASVGTSTAVVRQWGMAIPPGRPVAAVPSRAIASSPSRPASDDRPASTTWAARARITSCLSPPRFASSRTSAGVIRSDMSLSRRGDGERLHDDLVGTHLLRVGNGRAGEAGGRAAVGHGERESVGGVASGDVPQEVAEQAGVARADGADDRGRGRGGVPRAVGGHQDGPVGAESGEHGLDPAPDQVASGVGRGQRVGLQLLRVVSGERRELLAVGLHQVRSGLRQ